MKKGLRHEDPATVLCLFVLTIDLMKKGLRLFLQYALTTMYVLTIDLMKKGLRLQPFGDGEHRASPNH